MFQLGISIASPPIVDTWVPCALLPRSPVIQLCSGLLAIQSKSSSLLDLDHVDLYMPAIIFTAGFHQTSSVSCASVSSQKDWRPELRMLLQLCACACCFWLQRPAEVAGIDQLELLFFSARALGSPVQMLVLLLLCAV